MGLFSRGPAAPVEAPGTLSSGRRLTSSLSSDEAHRTVEALMNSYRERQYPTLPHLVPAGTVWMGSPADEPTAFYAGADQEGAFLLFTFRGTASGSEIGVFPLGHGDARLTLPIIGHLKQRDASLTSIGTYPHGALRLTRPPVPDDLVDQTLAAAGYPATPLNLAQIADQLFTMASLKAFQYISSQDGDPVGHRYLRAWREQATFGPALVEPIRMVLDGLAAWDVSVLPYMQDIPLRIQGVVLQASGHEGSFWDSLERG
jgi:hypothetical protein